MSKCAKCERDLESPLDEYGPLMYPLCRDCFDIENDPDSTEDKALKAEIEELEKNIEELEDEIIDLERQRNTLERRLERQLEEKKKLHEKKKAKAATGFI